MSDDERCGMYPWIGVAATFAAAFLAVAALLWPRR